MSRGLGKIEKAIIEYLKEHKKCKEFEEIEIEEKFVLDRIIYRSVDKNHTWISVIYVMSSLLESGVFDFKRNLKDYNFLREVFVPEYKSFLRSVKSLERKCIIECFRFQQKYIRLI